MTRIRGYIFDMDGVLVNSEPVHVLAEQQTCREFDLRVSFENWERFQGRTAEAIFQELREISGVAVSVKELVAHKTYVYLELIKSHLEPIPEVVENVIPPTRSEPWFVQGLVTSSCRWVQKATTDKLGISESFQTIVTGDDVRRGKPNPEPYLLACARLGVSPADVIVIEDSVSGVRSAQAAGCNPVGLTTSRSEEELISAGAIAVLSKDLLTTFLVADRMHFRRRGVTGHKTV